MCGGLWIGDAAERIDVVVCRDRHAIRPAMIAKLECVGEAVRTRRITCGRAERGIAGDVFGHQPQEHIADDVVFPLALRLVRIEGVGFRAVAAVECLTSAVDRAKP